MGSGREIAARRRRRMVTVGLLPARGDRGLRWPLVGNGRNWDLCLRNHVGIGVGRELDCFYYCYLMMMMIPGCILPVLSWRIFP